MQDNVCSSAACLLASDMTIVLYRLPVSAASCQQPVNWILVTGRTCQSIWFIATVFSSIFFPTNIYNPRKYIIHVNQCWSNESFDEPTDIFVFSNIYFILYIYTFFPCRFLRFIIIEYFNKYKVFSFKPPCPFSCTLKMCKWNPALYM